jgi:hypothetical protein
MGIIEGLSFNWFLLYYIILTLIFIIPGLVWTVRPASLTGYLVISARQEKRPSSLFIMFRTFALFTLVSLFFSFFPFSAVELAFTLWSIGIIYLAGSFLLRWDVIREIILEKNNRLNGVIRKLGAAMMATGVLVFLLCLIHLEKGPP